jgi:hypothetical protein
VYGKERRAHDKHNKHLMSRPPTLTWSGTIGTLYGIVGAWQFSFTLNLFWWERSGAPIFDKIKLHSKLPSAILIGLFAIIIVNFVLVYLCNRYRDESLAGRSRIDRLPLPFIEVPRADDALPRALRLVFFLAFVIGPLYVAGHFLRVLGATKFFDRRNLADGGYSFFEWGLRFLQEGTWSGDNRFRIGDPDGVAFFPTLEPYLLVVLFGLAVIYVLCFLVRLIMGGRRRSSR